MGPSFRALLYERTKVGRAEETKPALSGQQLASNLGDLIAASLAGGGQPAGRQVGLLSGRLGD